MRCLEVWADRLQDRDAKPQPVHTVAWLSSAHLIAGAGSLLLGTIYAVAVAAFNGLVASSGADKTVVLWNYTFGEAATTAGAVTANVGVQLTPAVKYSHADSVQCLAFSPVSGVLCSGTASDFGLWNPETRSVTKTKVSSKITCCSWSSDGQFVALGMYNGTVSIRTKLGEEHVQIDRGPSPIWALQWNPASRSSRSLASSSSPAKPANSSSKKQHHLQDANAETLLVTDWSQTIAHYRASGKLIGRERSTSAGSDGSHLWSVASEPLVRIGPLLELGDDAWIWAIAMSPSGQQLAWCTQQGAIGVSNVMFHTVHALHGNKYAYRSGLTDVVIQHFDSSAAGGGATGAGGPVGVRQFKLSCRDHVKKLAIYQDKLALLLPSRILVYEQPSDTVQQHPLEYRLRDKLDFAPPDCNLLVITSSHLLFCQESTLAMYDFLGTHERSWRFPALIRYIKVLGGPPGREAVVLGMRDGWTYLVYLDNAFPVPLVQHASAIRCVDVNRARTRVAVVDDLDQCCVYAMDTFTSGSASKGLELVYQESGATSVAWNHDHDDLLCFSGRHTLTVKAGTYPALVQPHTGFVVGFKGTHLYSLHQYSMTVSQVPLATCLYQYMDRKDWPRAMAVAQLGVGTDADWAALAYTALEDVQLSVARQCFARVKDFRMLAFIGFVQSQLAAGTHRDLVVADVLAMRGKLDAAAELMCARGHAARAVAMYTDLGLYEYALRVARANGVNAETVLKAKALALRDRNDHEAAAETYLQVGDVGQAVKLLVQHGAVERLVVVVQTLGDKLDSAALAACVAFFKSRGRVDQVANVLKIMGDWKALVQLYIGQEDFETAFKIVDERGLAVEVRRAVDLAHAQYLLTKMEDFAGAMAAFERAGGVIGPFGLSGSRSRTRSGKLASLLYAYHHVFGYLADPFTDLPQATLLAMARYLVTHMHSTSWIPDMSRAVPLVALVRLARDLGAPQLCVDAAKLARGYRLPAQWQAIVDTASILAAGQVSKDGALLVTEEELVPICFACSGNVPLLLLDPRCPTCRVPIEFAMHAFDALPVVQFEVVGEPPLASAAASAPLTISTGGDDGEDPMVHLISLATTPAKREYPIKVDADTATKKFKKDHVISVPVTSTAAAQTPATRTYYRILTDVAITVVHLGCPLCRFDALGLQQQQQQQQSEGHGVKKQAGSAGASRTGGGSAGSMGRTAETGASGGGMGR
ncbi:hypothetical protein BCR44DRAFT_1486492 [Catenaria anguillulae PL171]|uniref:Intraflagellar transport protein 122 homolog n=1 Tax=Catenaria anguillulae PL171 TaxID=765915 RepID=A0A1Y2HGH1_9FUNG|nr:hypothetical protein BCR44DRAFT_1486492 [Catenaria anguillulae PL171]